MKAKTTSFSFISALSILLVILLVTYLVVPKVRFALSPESNVTARKNTARMLYNKHDPIDMRELWEIRNTVDSGAYRLYTRKPAPATLTYPDDIDFSMSCINSYPQEARLFAQYVGTYWSSFEYVVAPDAAQRILEECFSFQDSDIYQDFRSSRPGGLALFLIRDNKTLKNTVGFLDYNETDKELVGENVWFSYSYLSLAR